MNGSALFCCSLGLVLLGALTCPVFAADPQTRPVTFTAPAERDGQPGALPILCNYADRTFDDRGIKAGVWHEKGTLRFRFDVPMREDYQPKLKTGRDQPYFRDDCVELHFRVGPEQTHHQLVFNLAGEIADKNQTQRRDWTSTASADSYRKDGRWLLDVTFPLADLGLEDNDLPVQMLFNAVVRCIDPEPGRLFVLTAVPCTERQFADPKNMGILRLTRGESYVNDFSVSFHRKEGQTVVTGMVGLKNAANETVKLPSNRTDRPIRLDPGVAIRRRFVRTLKAQKQPFTVWVSDLFCFRTTIENPYRLDVRFYRFGPDDIRLRLVEPDRASKLADTITFTLAGQTFGPTPIELLDRFVIPASAVPVGDHEAVLVFQQDGKEVHREQLKIRRIEETPIDFDLRDLDVSKHYPAVQVDSREIHAARSIFDFAGSALPKAINVAEGVCRVGPVELLIDGKPCELPAADVAEAHRNFVRYKPVFADVDGDDVRLTASVDYDGLVWADATVGAQANQPRRMAIKVPLTFSSDDIFYTYGPRVYNEQITKEGFRHLHDPSRSIAWSKPLPEGSTFVEMSFGVQVVDDFGGMALYIPTRPAGLELKNYDRIVELRRTGRNVDMLLHLADGEHPWPDGKLAFDFGLQPLPVRTLKNDYMQYDIRKMHRLYYEPVYNDKTIPEGTVMHVVQRWTELQSYFDTVARRDALLACIPELKKRDIKLLTYVGFEISDQIPEAELYLETCANSPMGEPWIRKDTPKQRSYAVCYGSLWGDYYLKQLDNMIDKYGQRGVYMDGTLYPKPCSSPYHGHRTVDSRGRVVPVFITKDIRRFSQILYRIGQKHDPDFVQDLHASGGIFPLSMGLVTNTWNGEQIGPILGRHGLPIPMHALRAQFNSRVVGIPIELLTFDTRSPGSLAMALPFDTLPRLQSSRPPLAKFIEALWLVYRDLNLTRETFTGFWMPEAKIKDAAGKALVSYYDTPKHLVAVISSHPHAEPITAEVDFGEFAARLDPIGKSVLDRGGPYELNDGKLKLELSGHDFRMICFEKK